MQLLSTWERVWFCGSATSTGKGQTRGLLEFCPIHFQANVEFGDFPVGHRVDQRTVKNKAKYTQFSLFFRVFLVINLGPKTSKMRPVLDSQKSLELFIISFSRCLMV